MSFQSASGSSELVLQDGDASGDVKQGALPTVQVPPGPSSFAKQLSKLNNVVFSSFIVSMFRAWTIPAEELPSLPNKGNLPAWFQEEYRSKGRFRYMGRHVLRDTGYLTAAAYLMEGVEGTLHSIRGQDDALNKIAGGTAAGGLMGYAWFPTRAYPRAILGLTGALVGYVSYSFERGSRTLLLEQQHRLEKEVLGARDDQLKPEVDTNYLRQLIKMRQKQLADAAEALRKSGGGPLVVGQPVGQGNGTPGNCMPDWVKRAASNDNAGPSSQQAAQSGLQGEGESVASSSWRSETDRQRDDLRDEMQPSVSGQLENGAQGARSPDSSPEGRGGGQRSGFLGGLWGRGNRQKPPADTLVAQGGEMLIREASDDEIQANEMKEDAAEGMVAREESRTRHR